MRVFTTADVYDIQTINYLSLTNANLGVQIAALLHESPDSEPEAVRQRELILNDVLPGVTRMWIVPLVRAEPCYDEHRHRHQNIRRQDVQPDLDRQWIHKGEESRRVTSWHL